MKNVNTSYNNIKLILNKSYDDLLKLNRICKISSDDKITLGILHEMCKNNGKNHQYFYKDIDNIHLLTGGVDKYYSAEEIDIHNQNINTERLLNSRINTLSNDMIETKLLEKKGSIYQDFLNKINDKSTFMSVITELVNNDATKEDTNYLIDKYKSHLIGANGNGELHDILITKAMDSLSNLINRYVNDIYEEEKNNYLNNINIEIY